MAWAWDNWEWCNQQWEGQGGESPNAENAQENGDAGTVNEVGSEDDPVCLGYVFGVDGKETDDEVEPPPEDPGFTLV